MPLQLGQENWDPDAAHFDSSAAVVWVGRWRRSTRSDRRRIGLVVSDFVSRRCRHLVAIAIIFFCSSAFEVCQGSRNKMTILPLLAEDGKMKKL